MATYVSLLNWTQQGIANFRDTTSRAREFSELMEKAGGRVREILWTLGEYDLVCIVEAPDDETLTATLLRLGEKGNVRSRTMRAFSAEEMERVIERAG